MEGGAWWAAVHGVAESDMTATSHSLFTFMEKEMATHSSVLAWNGGAWWGRTELDTTKAT